MTTLTSGRSTGPEPLTSNGPIEPPKHLMPLLKRAVAARKRRQNEDIEAWAHRLAKEAAEM